MKKRLFLMAFASLVLFQGSLIAQPTITSFLPSSGPVGTSVVISGTNFSATAANNTVFFGAVKAAVTAATTTSLTVTVPAGTTYQPISVTNAGLTAYSRLPFVVTFTGGGLLNANSFASKLNFTTATGPTAANISDIDGDGKADISISNNNISTGNSFSVLRNTSTGTAVSFASKIDFTTVTPPADITTGDLDGDGKPDVVIGSNLTTTLSTFRNTSTSGNVSFATRQDFTVGNNGSRVLVRDFDIDGKPDVLVIANGLSILRNTSTVGTISLAAKTDFFATMSSSDVAVSDIDGDGKPDIISVNSGASPFNTPQVSVYRNTSTVGAISFAASVDFALTSGISRPIIADLDSDGKLDIGVSNITSGSEKISFFRNTSSTGAISLDPKVDISIGYSPFSFAIADLDGDGKPDLAVEEGNPNTVALRKNTTTGTTISFASAVNPDKTSYTSAVFTADVDSDGRPEIITINNNSGTAMSVYKNLMGPPTISSFTPTSATAGKIMTITGTNFTSAGTSVSIGGVSVSSFTVNSPSSITVSVDIVFSGSVSVTTPWGTGTLAGFTFLPGPSITSFSPSSGAVGSSVTIAGSNFSATVANNIVYFGAVRAVITAATTTSLTVKVPSGATYQPITVTTGNLTASSAKPFDVTFTGIALASNSFDPGLSFQTGSSPRRPVIADLDNDGKPEMVFANNASNSISIVPNTGGSGLMSFANKIDVATTSAPGVVTTGDLDGDGKIDIVACINSTISVFKNTSTSGISFAPKTDIAYIGFSGPTVIVQDIDGDGRSEIIVPASIGISIFRNISTGSTIAFAQKLDFPLAASPSEFAVGDIDGDGKPDLVAAIYFNNTISVLRSTSTLGTISFAAQTDYPCNLPFSMLLTDLNNDGRLDIAASNSALSIFENTGTLGLISFAPKVDFVVPATLGRIISGDVDGDGKADILGNYGKVLHNATNGGSILFDPLVNVSLITSNDLALGDMDGNGKPDIVALNSSDGKVFRNQINEPIITSFSPKVGGPGTVVTINGFNLDLALVTFGGVSPTSVSTTATKITAVVGAGASGQVKVVTGSGVGVANGFHFFTGPVISSFAPLSGIAGSTVTINGSGFSSTPANNSVRFGTTLAQVTSGNAFQLVVKVPGGATVAPITVTTGNLTGYSTETFNATSSKLSTLTSATFVKNDVTVASNPQAIATGDFDDDGKPDLAVINGTNLVSVFSNTSSVGNTTLGAGIDLITGSAPVDLVTGDFNLDGKLDIAVANSSTSTVSVFNNTSTSGAISFAIKIDFTVSTNPQGISVGDLNGDARPDIVTSNFTGSNLVSVLLNSSPGNGSTSFAAKSDFTAGSFPTDVAIADLDNDSNAEMIVSNGNAGSVTIFKNTITGGILSFQPKTEMPTGNFPLSVAAGEINGDGWIDFVVANNSSSNITVFKNTGDGTLNFYKSTYTTANGPWAVTLGDMDGDGNPDINLACSSSNVVSMLRNVSGNFSTKIDYATGAGTYGLVALDIDGDGTTDIATVNNTDHSISLLRNNLPSLISFTPTSAGPGTTVTITGTDLTNISGVSFGASPATSFNSVSATSITAVVPVNATNGNVTVTNSVGSVSLPGFVFLGKPVIYSFTPTSAGPGTTVTITGTNLNGATSVSFGGTAAASFSEVSSKTITALVGSGTSGIVSITTPGGTATLAGFTFVPQPTVTSFNPTVGGPGVPITITGTNFTGATAVSFGGVAASSFTVLSATSIKAAVAIGASGDISITTPGGIGTISGFIYDVTVTAIEPISSNEDFVVEIFPNPSHRSEINFKLHKSWEGKLACLAVTDISGKVTYTDMMICKSANTVSVMHGELKPGMYILMLQSGQESARAKLIVTE